MVGHTCTRGLVQPLVSLITVSSSGPRPTVASAKAYNAGDWEGSGADNRLSMNTSFPLAQLDSSVLLPAWNTLELKPKLFPGAIFEPARIIGP